MASEFGFSGLRSRLADWRQFRMFDRFAKLANRDGMPVPANDSRELAQLIERMIIPQLLGAGHGAGAVRPTNGHDGGNGGAGPTAIDRTAVERFAKLALAGDAAALMDDIDAHIATGHAAETLFVELLAPAARKLGTDWEDDRQDFVDVTMALWRIQEALHALSERLPPAEVAGQHPRSALCSTMPGDQHSFGTLMVAECFQRAGWTADVLITPSQSDLNAQLAARHFDLLALTVSCECPSAALHNIVTAAKAVSANQGIRIMLGGPFINAQPQMVALANADAMAADGVAAVAVAETLVSAQARLYQQP